MQNLQEEIWKNSSIFLSKSNFQRFTSNILLEWTASTDHIETINVPEEGEYFSCKTCKKKFSLKRVNSRDSLVISQQECTESYNLCERWRRNEDLQREQEIRVEPHIAALSLSELIPSIDDWINSRLAGGLLSLREPFHPRNV